MSDELEWQTRRERINVKLKSLSQPWKVIRFTESLNLSSLSNHAVEEFPTENGPADYTFFVDGRLLGIMEAKRVGVDAENVLEQAKRYSKGVKDGVGKWLNYGVPLLYSTNGEKIYFLDVRQEQNLPREISSYHTPDAVNELYERGTRSLSNLPWNSLTNIERLRPYQRRAIQQIETAAKHGKREMLVAMATGTGKTFLMVSQIYRLLETGAFKRILFLVDRRALAAQAVREFASFTTPKGYKFDQEYEVYSQRFKKEDFGEDEPFNPKMLPNSYLESPKASNTFVYVSTIQRMTVNLFGWQKSFEQDRSDPDYEEDAEKISIPNHAFDLIIADECHRGYTASETAVWRDVMQYFDAVKIGLTATPAPHSLTLFKEIVSRYTTDEAIADGWLVDYEPYKISSNVLINGAFLKEGEHVGSVDRKTGRESYDELEDERDFPSEQVEKEITVPDTNRKIIEEIAKYANAHEKEAGRFPKILIFAANDLPHTSHAQQLVKICREVFNRGTDFVQKITGNPDVDRPLQRIREFRNRPEPKIVVTVDMLSTGVDIPAIEFIVFLRMVKSRILWTQMLGRGTRRCDDIGKTHFKIFDCFDGTLIEYFKNATDFKFDPPEKEHLQLTQIIENIYENVDRPYHTNLLVKRLRRIERSMSGEMTEELATFIPDGDLGKFTSHLHESIKNDFVKTMKILRDKDFQNLLLSYVKKRNPFIKAYEQVDEVKSEPVFTVPGGTAKPEDYLTMFSTFVRNNPEHIEAIKVLLERPKNWKTEVLNDLRKKLKENSFPENELQRAHKIVHGKSLADIITMVKHAAREEEPVLTSAEHVDKALKRLTEGKKFSDEQVKWLGYIRNHLVQNLTIDFDDLDNMPVFVQHGARRAAEKVFPDLKKLVSEINFVMAD